ncbi:MAG: WcaI family glycosyltransferase [Hyphomicrobiaceae bacterium]|nr:WcaI family glycosyltransferase [Hyphomicrobiaceae bacterium]
MTDIHHADNSARPEPLRIIIHSILFAPELIGIGKYAGEMAAWLAARGHEVKVVTGHPFYPAWRVEPPYNPRKFMREEMDGYEVLRYPLYVPSKPSGLKRLVHLATFAATTGPALVREAKRFRPDVIFEIMPALSGTAFALRAARKSGAKSWLHIQDLEVDAAFATGLLKGERIKKFALGIERKLLSRFDVISTISPGMKKAVIAKGVPEDKLVDFINWVDTDLIHPLTDPATARADFSLPEGSFIALYSGNLGRKQGIDVLAELARKMKEDPQFLLVIAGDGPTKEPLQQATRDLPNVKFLPLQPLEKLNVLLNCADVHLLPQLTDATDLVLPSKLTGQLASGRPVITVAVPGSSLALEVEGRGLIVKELTGSALSGAVRQLMKDDKLRAQLGRAARQRAQAYWQRDKVLLEFEKHLFDLKAERVKQNF